MDIAQELQAGLRRFELRLCERRETTGLTLYTRVLLRVTARLRTRDKALYEGCMALEGHPAVAGHPELMERLAHLKGLLAGCAMLCCGCGFGCMVATALSPAGPDDLARVVRSVRTLRPLSRVKDDTIFEEVAA